MVIDSAGEEHATVIAQVSKVVLGLDPATKCQNIDGISLRHLQVLAPAYVQA